MSNNHYSRPLELLIATHNSDKIIEYKKLFSQTNIKLLFATDLNVPEPIEDGKSFAENAIIKAKNAMEHSNKISLGEDSGLVINSLDGFPGIASARWAKEVGSYDNAFKELQRKLKDKSCESSFHACIAICYPNIPQPLLFTGDLKGKVTFPVKGRNGFGYAPIFTADGYDHSLAEISNEERLRINHRAISVAKLLEFWKGQ